MAEPLVGGTRTFLRPDGIVHVVCVERKKHSLADARAVIAAIRSLAAGRKILLLLDITITLGLDADARDHYNEEAKSFATAIAIVTSSTIGRVIANFIVGLNEGVFPIRLFKEEEAAVSWLRDHPAR